MKMSNAEKFWKPILNNWSKESLDKLREALKESK